MHLTESIRQTLRDVIRLWRSGCRDTIGIAIIREYLAAQRAEVQS